MQTLDFITELEVLYNGSDKLLYKIFMVGPNLYLARPNAGGHTLKEVYLEKDSEGWKHFTPITAQETPEAIAQQLLSKVDEYHHDQYNEAVSSTAF